MIHRKCMYEHQRTPTCKHNGLLLDETQKESHKQELKEEQKGHCKNYYEKHREQVKSQKNESRRGHKRPACPSTRRCPPPPQSVHTHGRV